MEQVAERAVAVDVVLDPTQVPTGIVLPRRAGIHAAEALLGIDPEEVGIAAVVADGVFHPLVGFGIHPILPQPVDAVDADAVDDIGCGLQRRGDVVDRTPGEQVDWIVRGGGTGLVDDVTRAARQRAGKVRVDRTLVDEAAHLGGGGVIAGLAQFRQIPPIGVDDSVEVIVGITIAIIRHRRDEPAVIYLVGIEQGMDEGLGVVLVVAANVGGNDHAWFGQSSILFDMRASEIEHPLGIPVMQPVVVDQG